MLRHVIASILLAGLSHGQDATYAQRVKCELDTATGSSMGPRSVLQGTTPVWSAEQYRRGQATNASASTRAVLQVSVTATSAPVYTITNQATSGYGYLIQWPTIGTNSGGAQWRYRITYQDGAGHVYWTGNGAVTIEASGFAGQGGLVLTPLPAIYTNHFGE
jgi:hypothetical protein